MNDDDARSVRSGHDVEQRKAVPTSTDDERLYDYFWYKDMSITLELIYNMKLKNFLSEYIFMLF